MSTTSLDKDKIRILLLEGIHPSAVETLQAAGYNNIETFPKALPEDELKAKIADAHFIGIRSRTQLTADVLAHAKKLTAIGCFCIGTNQVDLTAAATAGIAVLKKKAVPPTVANGKSLPLVRLKFAEKCWASSAMAPSACN